MNKEQTKTLHSLYIRLDELKHQHKKISDEKNKDILISAHLSQTIQLTIPVLNLLDWLSLEIKTAETAIIAIGGEV